ncbi:MAG TPA: benzoate-CoA ligase family protein [Candidatus Limnocylindria bacterium]|nr:benzoate-CoA ligase family protein [Candidatus Limnocylindria bacterium]
MTNDLPEQLNIADRFLDARVREGRGSRRALVTDAGVWSYADVQALANRFGNLLATAGVEPEHRVLIALPDAPEYVGALFGTLKLGAVVVMVNPALPAGDIGPMLEYTRARAVVTHRDTAAAFLDAARGARLTKTVLVAGDPDFDRRLAAASPALETFPCHRDDPALWLFSGGTTGRPKGVVQTHQSFANTTSLYGAGVIGYTDDDLTLSVPKLYFGYATGSNLFFPFAAGGAAVLFPEPPTVEAVFERIRRHRPTVLINVPTMINKMVSHPDARAQDLSCVRVCTTAGEALPVELYERWKATFGVELLDGLGTAEMWHIFISNRPGDVRPGTLGTVVPGFEVKVCDEHGRELPAGETGWLWVRGASRAIGYWQHMEKTMQAFRGEWYVSGDLIRIDADGAVTYCGRGDEMLKVSGKWLVPQEVEGCLLQHPDVAEAAVVGMTDANGLVKPLAYVVCRRHRDGLDQELKAFVRDRLEPYKHPRDVVFVDALPRTHLGKVDRGRLRGVGSAPTAGTQDAARTSHVGDRS